MVSKTIVVGSIPTVPAKFISYRFISMTLDSKVFEYLRNHNIRITKHIQAILDIIIDKSTPIDARAIYNNLISNSQLIDLSTIHRILDKLHKIRLLDAIYGEKANYYELSSQFLPHHHHFTCIKCGQITDIDICMMNPILNSLEDTGTPLSHSFEIKGICNNCKLK
jgi:Fur family zinc uptake transcriptional regulator